jgi:hypothetical protein
MVWGVSTRRDGRSLEPLPSAANERGISKSAVSERFVYGTERKLAELMSRKLSKFCLTVLFIDGVHFDEHVVLAARWGWMSTVTNTCSVCGKGRPKMR